MRSQSCLTASALTGDTWRHHTMISLHSFIISRVFKRSVQLSYEGVCSSSRTCTLMLCSLAGNQRLEIYLLFPVDIYLSLYLSDNSTQENIFSVFTNLIIFRCLQHSQKWCLSPWYISFSIYNRLETEDAKSCSFSGGIFETLTYVFL